MEQSHPHTQNDERIAQLVQEGDKEAFGLLIIKYEESIKRYAKKFVFDPEEINDVSQTVFLKAFENIQSFNVKLKFSTWLYRIAHNELVNLLRKKKMFPLFDLDTFWPHLHPGKKEIEKEAERKLMLADFEECFDKMQTKYREVIILYYIEDLSYGEISEVLHTPQSTVGVRLKRARQILQKICENNKKLSNIT